MSLSGAPAPRAGSGRFQMDIASLGMIELRPLVLDTDTAMLHDWFNQDYARHWGMSGKTLVEVREKYASLLAEPGHEVLIGSLQISGEPVFLLECYAPALDLLGEHYAVQTGDRGFHFIKAPLQRHIPALTRGIMQTINAYIFCDPAVQRIVAEPDIRNRKVLLRCVQSGYRLGKVVHLPHKTARMVVITRAQHQAFDGHIHAESLQVPGSELGVWIHLMLGRIGRKIGLIPRQK